MQLYNGINTHEIVFLNNLTLYKETTLNEKINFISIFIIMFFLQNMVCNGLCYSITMIYNANHKPIRNDINCEQRYLGQLKMYVDTCISTLQFIAMCSLSFHQLQCAHVQYDI